MDSVNIFCFAEIFKFRKNMSKNSFAKFLKMFLKSRNLNISGSNYIFKISRSRASKLFIICKYFNILKFFQTVNLEPLRSYFAKIAHKVAKSKYFVDI